MTSKPGLLLSNISVPAVLTQSVACSAIKGHIDTRVVFMLVSGEPYSHWGHGVIWARTTAEGHIWVSGNTRAKVCVDVLGPWYYLKKCRRQGPRLPCVAYYAWPCLSCCKGKHVSSSGLHSHIGQTYAVALGHVWVHGPTIARVWADVHGSCYHKESKDSCIFIQGLFRARLSLKASRIADSEPLWTLQQETRQLPTIRDLDLNSGDMAFIQGMGELALIACT